MHKVRIAVGILGLTLPWSAWAQDRDLRHINEELDALAQQILTTGQQDLGTVTQGSTSNFDKIFDRAETFYVMQDYPRAALLLLPLLQPASAQSHQDYGKALWYLADSQYHIGSDVAARDALQQVVARRDNHMVQATRALIALSDRARDWTGVDAAINALRMRGPMPVEVAYEYAKSLLTQKRAENVDAAVGEVPRNHPMYGKARYLVGVAAVERKDYTAADNVFSELRALADNYDDAAFIRDLSTVNRGRLFLEKGQSTDAVSAYSEVPRQSQVFDDALYETIWTYLRQAGEAKTDDERDVNYKSALQDLEIFLLSDEHPELEPDARILMGDILTRLGRVDDAQQVYLDVVGRYAPMRDQVGTIKSHTTDPVPLFVSHGPSDLAQVSPLVANYAADERHLKRALEVSHDLNDSEEWIEDSGEILDRLWAALDSGGSLSFFPGLRDTTFHKLAIENELVHISARLADVEAEVVADSMTAGQKRALDSILAQRKALEQQRTFAPRTQEDYEHDLAKNLDKAEGSERDLSKLRFMIEEQRRGVTALRTWMLDNPGALDERSREELEAEMKQHTAVTDELEAQRDELAHNLEAHRAQVASGNEDAPLQDLRERYVATLQRERELLDGVRPNVSDSERAYLARIDSARTKIATGNQQLTDLSQHISEVLAQRTLESKADLLVLQRELEDRRQEMNATREGAGDIVHEVAVDALQNVQDKLNEIVLRGDVGLTDVAWQLKEEETRDISRRVNAQHNELEILDNEYKEVITKDGKDRNQ